jgi:RNA polymerase sigma factor (sigma-70 family)
MGTFMLLAPATAFSPDSEPATRPPMSVEVVIRENHGALLNFLRRRMRTPEDAHDVAQEAYVRMMQYEGARDIHSPSSLLFRIATNMANDFARADHSRRVQDQCNIDDHELPSREPSAEQHIAGAEDLATLLVAIRQLPTKCQQVFLLSRVKHMTYPEIAKHCGISVKMVEKHISHALAVCMKKVGDNDRHPSFRK